MANILRQLQADLQAAMPHGDAPEGCCKSCGAPYRRLDAKPVVTEPGDVWTSAGWSETRISKMCEHCWTQMFAGDDEEKEDEGG